MSIIGNRDYTVIVDASGSMSRRDVGGETRWKAVQESTYAIAAKCASLDPDGITVYVFADRFTRYDHVGPEKIDSIFSENEPNGRTNLHSVLEHAFEDFFRRRSRGEVKSGDTILVVTDGAPDNEGAVARTIIEASRKISRDEELAVSFVQIGTDPEARKFLRQLDDRLMDLGATFDIVDTLTFDEMGSRSLTDVLISAIKD